MKVQQFKSIFKKLLIRLARTSFFVSMMFLALACDSQDSNFPSSSLAETLGLTQYSGQINPIEIDRDGAVTVYEFDPAEGPICIRGAPFRTSVRETTSRDLVIFLQGGGACWSDFCLVVTSAPEGIPSIDILNPGLEENPVADWNMVYLPYCDGSFFVGDASHNDNINDNGTRYHRGLANLTGALEVAIQRFPNPDRIVLAGSSGGAYGLIMATPLVRHYYPQTELIVMADSGIGLARTGDLSYAGKILEEFNLTRFIPEDCPDCLHEGHLTGIIGYVLSRDPNVRIGLYSTWYDSVLARTFIQIPSEEFADALQTETDRIHTDYPARFRRFINDGTQHTTLLGDLSGIIGSDISALEIPPEALGNLFSGNLQIGRMNTTTIDDLTVAAWLSALIDNDTDTWVDIQEPRGPAPDNNE